jgi:hypothetical protein
VSKVGQVDAMALGERILELLGEGAFAATYKQAVLLALVEICIEKIAEHPNGLESVTAREVAEKVIVLYWWHTRLYEKYPLRQNNTGQAAILKMITEFQSYQSNGQSISAERAKKMESARWKRLLDDVEWKLIEMPLPRLQIIGNRSDPFLYEINWDQSIRKGDLYSPGFDNRIRFKPGVPEGLVRLSPLLKPMIQRCWTLLVAKFNRLEVSRLEEFLFGEKRISLTGTRDFFRELQANRCFYCEKRLDSQSEVDHFIPWSRHPNNAVENLVIAHANCNHDKRDYLASAEHLSHWIERMRPGSIDRNQMDSFALAQNWDTCPNRSRNITSAIYLNLPSGYNLWHGIRSFLPLDRERIQKALCECTCF